MSDVRAMEDYLINDLHVPNDRIQCLVSPHPDSPVNINASDVRVPSRAEIVGTLLGLIDKTEIQFVITSSFIFLGMVRVTNVMVRNTTTPITSVSVLLKLSAI